MRRTPVVPRRVCRKLTLTRRCCRRTDDNGCATDRRGGRDSTVECSEYVPRSGASSGTGSRPRAIYTDTDKSSAETRRRAREFAEAISRSARSFFTSFLHRTDCSPVTRHRVTHLPLFHSSFVTPIVLTFISFLADMSSRPFSKFLSRAWISDVVRSAYDLLITASQIINPIKSSPTTQPYDNEAAVKDFQNAVSALLPMPDLGLLIYRPCRSSRRASRRTMSLMLL